MFKGFFPRREWSLHNPLKAWTLQELTLREAQLLVHSLSTVERKLALVWKKDWTRWKHFDEADCQLLIDFTPETSGPLPALPENMREDGEITSVRMETQAKEAYTRSHERVQQNFSVDVILGTNTFHTSTCDFSEGGLKFNDTLPDWVAGYFTVVLKAPERTFEITCILVEDQKIKKTRVEVVETEDEESQLPHYRSWVASRRRST